MSYLIKGAPFRYKGAVNVEDCKTAEDVMSSAGLNWQVEKANVFAKMKNNFNDFQNSIDGVQVDQFFYGECNNAYAIYRKDLNIPLGIVKGRYTPVQNVDAFSFFNDAIGKNKAIWQTAGYFGLGERIFVSAKLPNNILVNGDPVENYLVFTNSHDGSTGVKILFTPIRVICENTLNAAIANCTSFVSFRHTKSVHSNIDMASEILGICKQKSIELEQKYTKLFNTKMSDLEVQEMLCNIILNDKEKEMLKITGHTIQQIVDKDGQALYDTNISTKKANVIHDMNEYYYLGIGQSSIIGTAWGAYNAVTGYYSNIDNSEGQKRMDSLLYGDKSKKIEYSGNLLIAA